jgi:cytochrome c oxidase assembly protein subunit 15
MDAFENPASAQFHHRWLAAIAALGVVSLWFRAKKHSLTVPAFVMLVAVACQFLLGVFTLLYQVPVSLGTWHQAGAAALLITVLWVAHGLTRTPQV